MELTNNMGWIQDKIAEFRNKKAEEKEMKIHYLQQKYVEEDYEQNRTSHYERELIRHKEELRQKRIKEIVKGIRKRDNRKFWSGKEHNLAYAPNVFLNHTKIFNRGNMFAKQKNVFNGPKNFFHNHKKLFKMGGKR